MDSCSVVASSRSKNKNKPSKRLATFKEQDIISNLPDFIITHILSFLPIKDAVRTSVLSKRWIQLWTFMTHLFFQDRDRDSRKRLTKLQFVNSVYWVLLHLNSRSIETFSLVLSMNYDPSQVNVWICAVLGRRIKKLCVHSGSELALPSYSLSKFQSLEELELWLRVGSCSIRVRNSVCLSSLTILKLSGITLMSDSSNNSEELYLKLPVLKKCEMLNCPLSSFKLMNFEVPLLQVLSIESINSGLMSHVSNTALKFWAPSLEKFNFGGYVFSDTILFNLSTAKVKSVTILEHNIWNRNVVVHEEGILACKLLKQFSSNVESLRFELPTRVVHENLVKEESLADFPVFEMLSRLEFGKISDEFILGLLLKAPFLKTLVIKGIHQFNEEMWNSAIVGDYFLSNLQVVEFRNFGGEEHELCFVKYMMKNAKDLERLIFCPTWKLEESNLEQVKEKIFSFKKEACFANIDFSSWKSRRMRSFVSPNLSNKYSH